MDYLESAQHAFQARQFLEAERFYLQALKSLDPSQAEPVLARLFEIAKALRPQSSHRELESWLRSLASAERWDEIIALAPENYPRGFVHELRAESFFKKGLYGQARSSSFAHGTALQEKFAYPALLKFSRLYQARFPHTIAFKFQEVSALVALNLVVELDRRVAELVNDLIQHWGRWEDVDSTSRVQLLDTLVITLSNPTRSVGRISLLAHYAKLTLINQSGGQYMAEDWKRLVEVMIHQAGWNEWALAMESAISQGEEELAHYIKSQVRRQKNFSYVKWTQGRPSIKQWWGSPIGETDSATSENFDYEDVGPVTLDPAQSAGHFQHEDDALAEESAIRHLRLSPPTNEMIPDLIVTYLMMEFGRVVDWLIDFALDSHDQNQLHKKVRYLAAMRAIAKGNHHRALAFLVEMTGDPAITLEELQELKYAQGAVWKLLGNEKMSRDLFAEVERIAPGYRRLRERTW